MICLSRMRVSVLYVVSNFLSNARKFSTSSSKGKEKAKATFHLEVKRRKEKPAYSRGSSPHAAQLPDCCFPSPPSPSFLSVPKRQKEKEEVKEGSAGVKEEKRLREQKRAEEFLWHSAWVKIRLSVIDEGVGIDPSELSKLFKPYCQIRAGEQQSGGGTGLGLRISRVFVEAHCGGKIGAIIEGLGKGSEFFFEFDGPLAADDNDGLISVVQTERETGSPTSKNSLVQTERERGSPTSLRTKSSTASGAQNESRKDFMIRERTGDESSKSDGKAKEDQGNGEREGEDSKKRTPGSPSHSLTHEGVSRVLLTSNKHESKLLQADKLSVPVPDSPATRRRKTLTAAELSPKTTSSPGLRRQNSSPLSAMTETDFLQEIGQLRGDQSEKKKVRDTGQKKDESCMSKAEKQWTADVLLVDENSLIQMAVSLALKRLGLSVEVCDDGAKAVERFRDRGQRFRLVIMDRNMPNMEGPAAISAIRAFLNEDHADMMQNGSRQPVFIGLTGQTEESEAFTDAGAVTVLFKPVTPQILKHTLENPALLPPSLPRP
uniref:Response regulatory domain-containing protein n=1 Tax=Chromera velia CCMP2878 TaxID=1169474 RepID=A0A0K6SB49_9ALVE|eukprot:Cvel_106.t1-p1 / transcript=Cvel_106.t1 / gene=Cvel_106 / organism=Chromera_velia_CCMP2878 / gene_product=hypothetical protein / transcript_product=hypothetical protein / location=Cvel_scaffold8:114293-116138(-) / protein_length=545 / sequence_SO=supercontig / SO=protein_coding / is_pseudo=false